MQPAQSAPSPGRASRCAPSVPPRYGPARFRGAGTNQSDSFQPDELLLSSSSPPTGLVRPLSDRLLLPIDRITRLCRLDRAPDAFGGRGHFDMAHSELGERVDDGVDDRGECGGGAAFAAG